MDLPNVNRLMEHNMTGVLLFIISLLQSNIVRAEHCNVMIDCSGVAQLPLRS